MTAKTAQIRKGTEMRREVFVWKWAWVCASIAILVLVAACGRNDSTGDTSSGGGPVVVATMPAAKFTAVAQQSSGGSIVLTQTTALTQTVTADAQTIERGATIYVNRKCVDCHGPQGEGVAEKGAALAATKLTLQEFTNTLRTGGMGELGPDHLYGPSAVSPGGVEAVYAWLQSLPAQ